jgi:hypothetical protein
MEFHANGFKTTLIFPKRYPNGQPVLSSVWREMTQELRELEGGFSEFPIQGEWRSGESDESKLYFISVRSLERVRQLQALVTRWRIPFQQEAMYFDYYPVHYELITK